MATIDPLKMLKKELQQQSKGIEQTANTYFDKVEAYEHFHDFNSLDSDERAQSSELRERIANLVGELLNASAHSSLFDELDQQTLRDALRRAHAALRLCRYQQWDAYEIADEDILKAVVPAGHREDPISVSGAREEFMEALEAIKEILTRMPKDAHEKAKKASGVDTVPENSTTDLDLQQKEHLRVYEAAKIAGVSTRQITRWADEGYFPVRRNNKPKGEGRRIIGISGESFRKYLKGQKTGHS